MYVRRTKEEIERLEISLAPFVVNGRTFRVFGTKTEPHEQHVLDVDTDERWWMPHMKVRLIQEEQGLHGEKWKKKS